MEQKRGHVLAVPYPTQGHITPICQFCKRLISKGLETTLTLTTFVFNSIKPDPSSPISIANISDGYDQGCESPYTIHEYLQNFKTFGSRTIADIIRKHQTSDNPITCMVYDAFIPWALDVAREFGIAAAPFFTQSCAVNYVYYLSYVNHGSLKLPIEDLPFLELQDLPSFSSVSELELHEKELLSKFCPVLTIGPTVPSMYLDKRINSDTNYDLNLFDSKDAAYCTSWLNTRPQASVVYVAFGSIAKLKNVQMEELASAVSNFSFMWVVRDSEEEKLPSGFLETVDKDKILVLKWSPQLEVLSNKAIAADRRKIGVDGVQSFVVKKTVAVAELKSFTGGVTAEEPRRDLVKSLWVAAVEGASNLAASTSRYTCPLRYLSSVATRFCRYAWPLGSFNDSSTFFGHQNTPWGTEFIMKLPPTPDKD
ncbi:hypothetical protein YC2023_036812 [Brassica napus]